MRILQISYERSPKRNAPAGGDLGMFQNLSAMLELGHEVHLAILGPRDLIEPEVRGRAASIHELEAMAPPLGLRPLQRVLNPETFTLRFPTARGFERALRRLADRLQPDVIWADSTFALAFAPRANYPVVFGNYDFLYKLKQVRRATLPRVTVGDLRDPRALRRRIRRPDAMSIAALEALELRLAREAAHVMCVSASDSEFLRGQGIGSTHIPIVGPTISPPTNDIGDGPPRFFLFGNHNTAHAAALSEIRRRLWPALERVGGVGEWHQLGRPPRAPDDDWKWMERSFHKLHGFVEDLGTVFRVGDVSIVPYHHDTGFRTKFTVAAGYGVTSAGYTETFLCAPEFRPSADCIAAHDADELARSLRRVIEDRAWRLALGRGARQLYETTYTFEAQLPRYEQILRTARRGAR